MRHAVVAVHERVLPAPCPVDDLVGQHQGAGTSVGAQRTDRAGREHLPYPHRAQGPQVGAVGNQVRGMAVVGAVSRHEGDAAVPDRSDDQRVTRRAVRGVDHHGLAASPAASRGRSRR